MYFCHFSSCGTRTSSTSTRSHPTGGAHRALRRPSDLNLRPLPGTHHHQDQNWTLNTILGFMYLSLHFCVSTKNPRQKTWFDIWPWERKTHLLFGGKSKWRISCILVFLVGIYAILLKFQHFGKNSIILWIALNVLWRLNNSMILWIQ